MPHIKNLPEHCQRQHNYQADQKIIQYGLKKKLGIELALKLTQLENMTAILGTGIFYSYD